MTNYALLAHAKDGSEAIIQLDNGHPYRYKFGTITTYDLITDHSATVDPTTWETNPGEVSGNQFDTIDEVQQYLKGYAGGVES